MHEMWTTAIDVPVASASNLSVRGAALRGFVLAGRIEVRLG